MCKPIVKPMEHYTALLHTPPPVQATSAAREATTSARGLSTSGATDQRVGCDVTKGVTVTLSPDTGPGQDRSGLCCRLPAVSVLSEGVAPSAYKNTCRSGLVWVEWRRLCVRRS